MPAREVIDAAKALVGTTLRGKWHLDTLIGVGGSAAVFAATHRNGKRGALKILRRDLVDDLELRDRFLREGYVANLVGHPAVVSMLDDDVDENGTPFLVMELLEGSTLERWMRKSAEGDAARTEPRKRKPIALREVLRIAEAVLDVLGAAHSRGIVHGDIKPANIFLTSRGDVKLLDFGIARMTEGSQAGRFCEALGTPAYMSPEQACGGSLDGRTDLWSLGALMFALITGRRPRQGANAGEDLVMAARQPMPNLADITPRISEEIAAVVDRALTFDRSLRWPDAVTMQQAVRLALLLEQASGPAEEGLQVPLPTSDERTTVDAFRILRRPQPSRSARSLTPPPPASERTRRISVPTPPHASLSSFPPGPQSARAGPSTSHRLAFAGSLPPPPRAPRSPRAARMVRVMAAAMVVGSVTVGLLFTSTVDDGRVRFALAGTELELELTSLGLGSLLDANGSPRTRGAPTRSQDGGADATVDGSRR